MYYALAVVALMALIAVGRWDLVMGAVAQSLHGLRTRPLAMLAISSSAIVFIGILILTLRVIPMKVDPKRDAVKFVIALIGGYVIELWGTRNGLWVYYTGEVPPLWIVPAWPLGTLIVERMAIRAKERYGTRLGNGAVIGYWTLAVLSPLVVTWFAWGSMNDPLTVIIIAAFLISLFVKPNPKEDFWILIGGKFYVFFVAFWGATNNCWRYHVQDGSFSSLLLGVTVELFCDSAIVLTFIRLARIVSPHKQRNEYSLRRR